MGLSEFDLIDRYFARCGAERPDVELGVGDDAALLIPAAGRRLAWATDTLVAGRHFPEGADAAAVGHKALAVNLSDLAAMGAEPAWATLALTLPEAEEAWLTGFATGLCDLATEHHLALVGGDTTGGPLTVTVGVAGFVDRPLRRDGARAGDGIWVTGEVGGGGIGLEAALDRLAAGASDRAALLDRYYRPQPRVAAGRALARWASAAVDVSDGLAADLGHILAASGVGATLEPGALPLAPSAVNAAGEAATREAALAGGDDYELVVTLPPEREGAAVEALAGLGLALTRIGTIEPEPGLRGREADGRVAPLVAGGHDHFRRDP
ncbi:MAG: thiamine-phosphate kinase [Pseudomonadota bacterium]